MLLSAYLKPEKENTTGGKQCVTLYRIVLNYDLGSFDVLRGSTLSIAIFILCMGNLQGQGGCLIIHVQALVCSCRA